MYSNEELTLELEQLSGWKRDDPNGFTVGYLLRQLEEYLPVLQKMANLGRLDRQWWIAYVMTNRRGELCASADTPENCAAKLTIELFKLNVLTRGES